MDVLQILAPSGEVNGSLVPELSEAELVALYRHMLTIRLLDKRMLALQRQGRIAFYGTCKGQEASTVGSGSVLDKGDWIFPALREGGVLLMRGYPLEQYMAQLMGCALDSAHGRQMPCHFTSAEHHFVSLSSVIGTQIPQAVGAAVAARIRGDPTVVLAYFGDGATSSTDFHAAANFAAVAKAPCVLFCQNNQFAISVPFARQTASDGVAVKAEAYGMPGVAVDGNDVLAVCRATREAVQRARSGEGPTLIESVTYRLEGHSSSDDPTRYRPDDEVDAWEARDPIQRFRNYLELEGLVNEELDGEIRAEVKAAVTRAVAIAEASPRPALETMFTDVYAEQPAHLKQQAALADSEQDRASTGGAFPL